VNGRRGRRSNGLDAVLWFPLRDVDPRVGEHLLDVLEVAGIAAYLEPSADVGPYTRSVFLPSPPTDRLYVDRARRGEAGALVDEHADELARGPVPGRAAVRKELENAEAGEQPGDRLDEDAEWARIVAAFEAENGRPAADATLREAQPSTALPPAPHEPEVLDRPDEHFEPPPAPPLPAPSPSSLYAFLLVIAGVLLVGVPSLVGLSSDLGLLVGVLFIAGGAALVVSRMRDRSVDDGDDGAVV
jgi:hypothetical protein